MSRMIAVWGSPFSGKTVFAVKLASGIYEQYKSSVIVLHADMQTPVLPVLFPNYEAEDLFSVGETFSQTEITQESAIRSMVTVKGKPNLAFIGFKDGENKYTYASFGTDKVRTLFTVLKSLADFIIVDCDCSLENPLSETALIEADHVIRLAAPDLKSISFYASQLPLYADAKYCFDRQIQGINVTESNVNMLVDEIKHHFKDVCFTLPYCREILQQMQSGTLVQKLNDRKYNKKLSAIAERLVKG